MSTLPRSGLAGWATWVTLGLAVVGGGIAAVVLFASGRASEVNLTTAQFVPADAAVYFAVNTDLSSDQWVATFDLIERLGEEDPLEQAQEAAEDEGDLDWEEDVVPFLGGNAAVFVSGFDLDGFDVEGAVIVRCDDSAAALELVIDKSGLDFDEEEYGGVDYLASEDGVLFVARIGEHLVLAMDEDSLERVIDVHNGDEPSLADDSDFQSLRDQLTKNYLVFGYTNQEQLLDGAFPADDELYEALEEAGVGDVLLSPSAFVVGARPEGFEYQAAMAGTAGALSPMLEPRTSRFAGLAPADSAIFASTANVAQTWHAVVDEARDAIDEAFQEDGTYDDLDDALEQAGAEIGLSSIEELIDLFKGEVAVAAWFPGDDQDAPEVVLFADVADEAEATSVMDRIVEAGSIGDIETEEIAGVTVTTADDEDGEPLSFAVTDGMLLVGTPDGVRAVLEQSGPSLSEVTSYLEAVETLDSSLGSFAFFDLAAILRLTEGGIPVDLDEAERALEGAILNAVQEGGLIRFNGVLTIDD